MAAATVPDITISYDDQGDRGAAPVVLIHGHPFNRSMWAPQTADLIAAGYRVVTPDLRGYGETSVVPGVTPLEVFAADLAGLMDHLGLDRVVLGGLSMGGQIVMEFYRQFPGRVAGLVLADTFAAADPPEGRAAREAMAERLLAEVSVPTLVVVGTDEKYTPVGDAEYLHERIPDSTLAVIEGAAHLPNLERPAEFNAALRKFLAASRL